MQPKSARRRALALAFGAILLMLTVAPVSATIYSRERYGGTDAFSYECGDGNWIDVQAEFGGIFTIRAGKNGDEDAFFAHDNFWWHEIHTNRLAPERWIELSGNGNFEETRATRVSGSIFLFDSVLAGQPFMVRDSSGDVILRDSGAIRETILFDTLGDDTPGGEFIESVSFSVAGPHPGLFYDTCADVG